MMDLGHAGEEVAEGAGDKIDHWNGAVVVHARWADYAESAAFARADEIVG